MNLKLFIFALVAVLAAGMSFYFFQYRSNTETKEAGSAPASLSRDPGIPPSKEKTDEQKRAPFCPVPKPETLPPALELAFQPSSKTGEAEQQVSPNQQIAEITSLATKPRDEQSANALRWLIHQGDRSAAVRNEGLVTLEAWNVEWLAVDMVKMLRDEAQSPLWRSYCVQHLGVHFKKHLDQASLDALKEAAKADDREMAPVGQENRHSKAEQDASGIIRNQAVYSLALLAKDLNWRESDPERFKTFLAQVTDALAAKRPGTVVSALRAIAAAELKEKTADAERLASDEKQALEIRVAAVQALGAVGRAESIPILEACAKSSAATLARFAQTSMKALQLGK